MALIDSHSEEFSYTDVIDEYLCLPLGLTVDDLTQVAELAEKEATSVLSIMNPKLFSK